MPIVGMTGSPSAGRTTAAQALNLLGYEHASFANRLRHLIAMSTGLPEQVMLDKPDTAFERTITLQAFHIDGMCRLAAGWTTIPEDSPKRMRERAARATLHTPREVIDFVRTELFEACVGPGFWVDLFRVHYAPDRDSNLVIDDVTSSAERQFIHSLNGLVIGIDRPGCEWSFEDCDLIIPNEGSVEQLQDRIVAFVFGHLRGRPMTLPDEGAPVITRTEPVADSVARQEAESLRKQLDELTARMRTELASRDKLIATLSSEKDALVADIRDSERQMASLTQQVDSLANRGGTATLVAPVAPPPVISDNSHGGGSRRRETDTAALAARLALCLGLEAGVGKDADGQSVICIDLPAGRVSWVVEEGSYPMLPRYDKAPLPLPEEERRQVLLDPAVKVAVSTDQALEREGSDLTPVSGVLKDLILLAEGCKIHRAYRAKQAPKGDCPTCWCMWEATERLRGMSRAYAD